MRLVASYWVRSVVVACVLCVFIVSGLALHSGGVGSPEHRDVGSMCPSRRPRRYRRKGARPGRFRSHSEVTYLAFLSCIVVLRDGVAGHRVCFSDVTTLSCADYCDALPCMLFLVVVVSTSTLWLRHVLRLFGPFFRSTECAVGTSNVAAFTGILGLLRDVRC